MLFELPSECIYFFETVGLSLNLYQVKPKTQYGIQILLYNVFLSKNNLKKPVFFTLQPIFNVFNY